MDDGNQRARRRSTKKTARIEFALPVLTPAEWIIFSRWVEDTLVDGTLPFTMRVWDGTQYVERVCRFAGDYTAREGAGSRMAPSFLLDVDDYIQAAP